MSKTTSDHGYLRAIILDLFPWLRWLGLDDKRDLKIRSATGRVHVAGDDGADDPAVHRVGDMGDGGRFTAAGNVVTYTGADGNVWTMTFAGSVVVTIVPVPPLITGGRIVTKATTGSARVTSG